ncbi:DNA 3'-5' helicase [Deinococcus saxicola]|uniref:UvrD-helicase domain-containing protein n=1 Tax=Deinococcus saxicola TaxID=249406 RepID=UPI0039EFC68C
MNQRVIPPHFTPEQRAFLSCATTTQAHIFLRATAGAGKTTTLLEAAWHLQQYGVYFAYNKHAVSDLQPRLPRQVRARTLHAHGLGLLNSQTAGLELARDKGRQVAARVMRGSRAPLYAAARAWDIAREESLVKLTLADAERLAARTDWRGHPRELQELIPAMHEAGDLLWQGERSADYTDMLWLPVRHAYGHHSLRLALVDEAQDLTPLRQQFVQHLLGLPDTPDPGRLIFVGDSDQSIYLWAGADPAALSRLKAAVGAMELPLSVSFRCPREVVRYARAYSSFIQPAPQAPPGVIEHVSAETVTYERGDTVLCRTNAPLIRLALELMTRRVSVSVVGRDLEVRLREALTAALPAHGTFRNDDVTELTRVYLAPLDEPLGQRIAEGDRVARQQRTELYDLARCLRYLAWVVSRASGEGTLESALALLKELCREDADADVILASVHRAKGKEWPRVTILYPELMPLAQGDEAEERAVQFVAVTRAQQVLRFAYGKEAWAKQALVKPGELPETPGGPSPTSSPSNGRPHPAKAARKPEPRPTSRIIRPAGEAGTLLGGDSMLAREAVRERLMALAEEDRALVRVWALTGLQALSSTRESLVAVHEDHLLVYEQAATLARMAQPVGNGRGVPICVFDSPLARVQFARKIRIGKSMIRLKLGEQDLRFDLGSGELVGAQGPLSTFILPGALQALRAS